VQCKREGNSLQLFFLDFILLQNLVELVWLYGQCMQLFEYECIHSKPGRWCPSIHYMLLLVLRAGVANLIVREGRLVFIKRKAGHTIVFIEHGAGRSSLSASITN